MSGSFECLKQEFIKEFSPEQFNFNSDDRSWVYAAPKGITYDDSIHYELMQRGNLFFVEFHIEGNGYQDYINRAHDCFGRDANLRNYCFFTYYSSKYWQTRTPVFTVEDLKKDIAALKNIVQLFFEKVGIQNANGQLLAAVQIYNHVTADNLLAWKLQIPQYQRPFCWDEKNINDFLDDISLQQKSQNGINCHIGSVILRKHEDQTVDIIDGQQRLTTLAIYQWLKNNKKSIPALLNTQKDFSLQEKRALHQAVRQLDFFCSDIDLRKIELSVVVLNENLPEDLAYTFFSTSNSTGKRLSDYDLLKTHHLRYISGDNDQEKRSANWHQLEKAGYMDDVLQKMLFRLRKWSNCEPFPIDAASQESRDIFIHYKSVDPIRDFSTLCRKEPRFNSLIPGGPDFFDFVDKYSRKYEDFSKKQPIQMLESYLSWHSYGVLCAGIKAVSFLFFCKFGIMNLKEAVYLISWRLSELRNETQVKGSYFNSKPVFREITRQLDQAVSDSQFFALLSNPENRYEESNQGQTAQRYWSALHEFLEKLSQSPFGLTKINFIRKTEEEA